MTLPEEETQAPRAAAGAPHAESPAPPPGHGVPPAVAAAAPAADGDVASAATRPGEEPWRPPAASSGLYPFEPRPPATTAPPTASVGGATEEAAAAAARGRSRSPRRSASDAPPGVVPVSLDSAALAYLDGASSSASAQPLDHLDGTAITAGFDLPSPKLGQLLGYKGNTIQKIKEVCGVSRLHIHDKEKAQRFHPQYQAITPIEISGTPEQVGHCRHLLEELCRGLQTEIGHLTHYMNVDPPLIGKIMGFKGQTVKEMTEVTNCYIEIQQYAEQGVSEGQPRLFIAGPPENVEGAVQLVERFIASPGSRLEAALLPGQVSPRSQSHALMPAGTRCYGAPLASPGAPSGLGGGGGAAAAPAGGESSMAAVAALLAHLSGAEQPGSGYPLTAAPLPPQQQALSLAQQPWEPPPRPRRPPVHVEPGAQLEERIIEIPARMKGHLLGLHGRTIELIQQASGVIKCHMQEKKGAEPWGNIHVQIVGVHESVEECMRLVNAIVAGDHSGIGHVTTHMHIDPSVVGKVMGHKGQTIKELTEATHCYIEIQQYPEQGVYNGQPRLFIAGPLESVEAAVRLVERFISAPGSRLDFVLGPSASAVAAPVQRGVPLPPPAQHALPAVPTAQRLAPGPLQPAAPPAAAAAAGGGGLAALSSALQLLAGAGLTSGGDRHAGPSFAAAAGGQNPMATALAALSGLQQSAPQAAPTQHFVDGGEYMEQTTLSIPIAKKGHLLGLRGQTIELVRRISGVKKCHMMDKTGAAGSSIPVQIVGQPEAVRHCIDLINRIVVGDHSGIGHATDIIPVEAHKVNGLMGHRGQTCTLLKDITSAYLDIQQGPQPGVPAGEARLFMSGPPENVARARAIVQAFLSLMDHVPNLGASGMGTDGLTEVLRLLGGVAGGGGETGGGSSGAALAAAAAVLGGAGGGARPPPVAW